MTRVLDKQVMEQNCPTLIDWVRRARRLRMPPAWSVFFRILASGATGFFATGFCFCFIAFSVWSKDRPACDRAPAGIAIEAVGMMVSLGLASMIATSLLLVLRPLLRSSGTIAASAAALVALCFCVNESFPLSEYLLTNWTWRLATLWCMVLGIAVGAILAARFRGARFLWIPAAALLLAIGTLKIVLEPVLYEFAK